MKVLLRISHSASCMELSACIMSGISKVGKAPNS